MATPWNFPLGAPADPRRDLPVFSISPNWQNGITEILAWQTDVLVSEQAVEQRRSVRRFPRRSFEANFMRVDNNRARLDMFMAGMGKKELLVPLWHEQITLGNGNNTGVITFPEETLITREWAEGDLAMITTGDPTKWFVVTVVDVNLAVDQITVQGVEASGQWPAGSRIIPLRVARVLDGMALTNPADRVGQAAIRFTLTEADERFTPSWGYCSPLWRFIPNRSDPIALTYDRQDYVLDFDSGVIDVAEPGNRAQVNQTAKYRLYGRSEVAKLRAFLYNARGRARRFYMPSFTADIHAAADMAGPWFDAIPNGFSDYMLDPQEARLIVGIDFKDGRPTVYRTIINIQSVLSVVAPFHQVAERFYTDQDIPPILKRDIERISFIVPSRFDQDAIELFHHTDNSTVVSTSIVTRSSVVEGMPPIECWVTSWVYPLNSIDEFDLSFNITGGLLGTKYSNMVLAPEAVDYAMVIPTGDFRVALKTAEKIVESLDYAMVIPTGDFRVALKTAEPIVESLDYAMVVPTGTLARILISTVLAPDTMDYSLAITGGSLT